MRDNYITDMKDAMRKDSDFTDEYRMILIKKLGELVDELDKAKQEREMLINVIASIG